MALESEASLFAVRKNKGEIVGEIIITFTWQHFLWGYIIFGHESNKLSMV